MKSPEKGKSPHQHAGEPKQRKAQIKKHRAMQRKSPNNKDQTAINEAQIKIRSKNILENALKNKHTREALFILRHLNKYYCCICNLVVQFVLLMYCI